MHTILGFQEDLAPSLETQEEDLAALAVTQDCMNNTKCKIQIMC